MEVLYGWLPINSAVKKIGVDIDEICKRCGQENETIEHVLLKCPESELAWKVAPVQWDGLQPLTNSIQDWMLSLFSTKMSDNMKKRVELTFYLLWQVWKARNSWQYI